MKHRSIGRFILLACLYSVGVADIEDPIGPYLHSLLQARTTAGVEIPPGSCGLASLPLHAIRPKRLVGATFAQPFSVPWIVSLRIAHGDRANLTICTGVLIRVSDEKEQSDIVLTTARCNDRDFEGLYDHDKAEADAEAANVDGSNSTGYQIGRDQFLNDLYAVVGSHFQVVAKDGISLIPPGAEKVKVERVVYHDLFDKPEGSFANDIAVVLLERPVNFSTFIQPICLPEPETDAEIGTTGILTGWGYRKGPVESAITFENQHDTNALRYMKLPLQSPESCIDRENFIPAAMLCVKYNENVEEGPCGWDSGIPYFFNETNGYTLHGIVGHKPNDRCDQFSSTTFTRVSSYINWIDDQVKRLSSLVDE